MATLTKVLTSDGLLYYTQLLKNKFNTKADKTELPNTIIVTPSSSNISLALSNGTTTGTATTLPVVTSSNTGLMTPAMLDKLTGSSSIILDGTNVAYNQMTPGNIYTKDGNMYIPVSSPSGNNYDLIEVSKNGIREKTNSGTSEIYAGLSTATTSANGLMSSSDKTKLDGIATGAEKNVVIGAKGGGGIDPVTGNPRLAVVFNVDSSKYIEIPYVDDTNNLEVPGLMDPAQKTKLDGIATGAQVNVIEGVKLEGASNNLTPSSKVVTIPNATTSSNGLMSSTDKSHLDEMYSDSIDYAYLSDIGVVNASTSSTSPVKNDYWKDNNILKWYDGSAWQNVSSLKLVRLLGSGNTTEGIYIYIPSVGFTELGTQSGLDTKAPINSPTFTGTPQITTTPTSGDNSHKIADTAFVQAAIAAAVTGSFKFVNSLPTTGEEGYIYLVPHTHAEGSTNTNPDVKDEYIWNTSTSPAQWELIGNTDLDLSNYWSTTDLVALTTSEITTIWNTGMSND